MAPKPKKKIMVACSVPGCSTPISKCRASGSGVCSVHQHDYQFCRCSYCLKRRGEPPRETIAQVARSTRLTATAGRASTGLSMSQKSVLARDHRPISLSVPPWERVEGARQ